MVNVTDPLQRYESRQILAPCGLKIEGSNGFSSFFICFSVLFLYCVLMLLEFVSAVVCLYEFYAKNHLLLYI